MRLLRQLLLLLLTVWAAAVSTTSAHSHGVAMKTAATAAVTSTHLRTAATTTDSTAAVSTSTSTSTSTSLRRRTAQRPLQPATVSVAAEVAGRSGGAAVKVSAQCGGKGLRCDHRLVSVNVTAAPAAAAALALSALPGTFAVTTGSPLVATTADVRAALWPGAVLALDGQLACQVDGAMSDSGFSLALPYPFASNPKATAAVSNLARVPGVTATAPPLSPSPASFVTLHGLSGDPDATDKDTATVMPGDVLYVEGAGPLVVGRVPEPSDDGSARVELLNPYPAPPLARGSAQRPPPLRVFRVVPALTTGRPLQEDAESVIDRIARQASDLFAHHAYGTVSGVPLPGTVAVRFGDGLLRPSVDLRPYVGAGSVLVVGTRFPIVVAADPPMTAVHMHATTTWRGPSSPGLPAEVLPFTLLPGAVTVVHGSASVTTSADLRALLRPADVVLIGVVPHLVVAPAPLTASLFTLTQPYPGPTAANVPIFYCGMAQLPGVLTVTARVARVDTATDLRSHLRATEVVVFSHAPAIRASVGATDSATFTSSMFTLAAPYAGTSARGVRVFRSGERLLPGTVTVTADSALVRSTHDLRAHLLPGDVVRIAAFPDVVVSGGEFGPGPGVSAAAFHITAAWAHASGTRLSLVATGFRRLPALVTVQAGSRHAATTTDVSDYLAPGAFVRIARMPRLEVSAAPGAVAGAGFKLALPFPASSVVRVPLYVNTGASGGGVLRRAAAEQSSLALGNVDPVRGSPFMTTERDLSSVLRTGDHITVAGHRDLVIAEPPSSTSLRVTLPYPGVTAKGIPAFKMVRHVKLSGTVSVTQNDVRAITTVDLRPELRVGDVVEVQTLQFVVVSPFTDKLFTLSDAFTGPSASGVFAYRVIAGSGPGLLMPGTISVTHGEGVALTTEDLSGAVSAGDRLRIGLREVVAKEPINRNGVTMQDAWGGTTARGLRMFNLGKSPREASLEELAAMKLRCRSIFCMAKIEEAERAIPTAFSRSLNAGQTALTVLQRDAAKKVGAVDSLGAGSGAQAVEVEKEWQRWYKAARDKLGATALKETHAEDGAAKRVKTLYGKR